MKQAIDGDRFGRLTLGDAYVKWFRTQQYYDSGAWRGTWELDGGGALMNQAIHSVDLLTLAHGPGRRGAGLHRDARPRADRGRRRRRRHAAVRQRRPRRHRSDHRRLSRLPQADRNPRLAKARPCSKRKTSRRGTSPRSSAATPPSIARWPRSKSTGGGAADPTAIGHHGHTLQFQDFVDAIRKDRTPAVDGPEGRKSVEIILAIYKSANTGKKVTLPLKSDPKLAKA